MSLSDFLKEEFAKINKKKPESHKARYNPKVRVGHWNEELMLREEQLKDSQKLKEKEKPLEEKFTKRKSSLCQEVALLVPAQFMSFGVICQIVAPKVDHPKSPSGLVLSVLMEKQDYGFTNHLPEGNLISASPHITPRARNCFRICSSDGRCRAGDKLMFGEPFALATAYNEERTYFVASEVPHLHSLPGRCKHPPLRLTSSKNMYGLWRAEPRDLALLDTPVPVGIPLVIRHVASNKNLSAEPSCWSVTVFGDECEASVHTMLDVYRQPTPENLWTFVTYRQTT